MTDFFALERNYDAAVEWRRQLHRHAQPGWLEFYATGFIAEKLSAWGYDIFLGPQIIAPDKSMFVPPPDVMEREYARTLDSGIKEEYLRPAKGGLTGVVGVLKGNGEGPVIAFRFDIDALEIMESPEQACRAVEGGYISECPGYAHMCGHDAHAATGLLLAQYFAENRETIKGTVKFIFQPDEEKVSGAGAMVARGVVNDVDFLVAGHVGANLLKTGQVSLNVKNMLAVTRYEILFKGSSAHATGRPDQGKNALLGACVAAQNLHAIARHGLGVSMVNVGKIQSGVTFNVIPDTASLLLELRAGTREISDYLQKKTREVVEGAAAMYALEAEMDVAVNLKAGVNHPDLVEIGTRVAETVPYITEIVPSIAINASEDFVVLADAVQNNGGKAIYVIHGTPVGAGQHSVAFDLDEKVILNAACFYVAFYEELKAAHDINSTSVYLKAEGENDGKKTFARESSLR